MRSSGDVRGSSGVACLVRVSLRNSISTAAIDVLARFMWVQVRDVSPLPWDIYIAAYYFPLATSLYAIHNDSDKDPFIELHAGIALYSTIG